MADVGALVAPAVPRAAGWARSRRLWFGALLAPALVVLTAVTILPFCYLVVTSFTPLDLTKPQSRVFAGLLNYRELIQDDRFWNSLVVQAKLSVATVVLQLAIGLALALLLQRRLPGFELARTALFIPMVLPPVVVAILWKVLFTPDISIVYWALGLLGLQQTPWLVDPVMALWAIIVGDVWEWTPFVMLILLAALQMLPEEPLEAARIDGASGWQSLRYIVLPLLKPAIAVAALFRFIDSVKAFPLIFIMTSGGPGTVTEATNYYAYLEGFSYTLVGYSSAIIVVMLTLTLLISWAIIKGIGMQVEVE